MNSAEKHHKFQRGIRHFNTREFFEAHEVWEEIWLDESEPEKTFLQGLIQIAAAFHHYRRGNSWGAELLFAQGIVKLSRFPDDRAGLEIAQLRDAAKFWARALGQNEKPPDHHLPQITHRASSKNG
jgi:uncharacterized protein